MKIKLNKIIKYLIYSDLVFYTGWGLISPIFAIFILNSIVGGTAFVVGLAAAIHLVIRSIVRIPFGMIVDSNKNHKRAYLFMVLGLFIAALVPLGYIFAKFPWHIYVLQGILGIMLAISTAGWTGIFTRHMDKGKESTEWGIDAVAVGLGPGIAGAVGGLAVTYYSFQLVFSVVGIFGVLGTLLLLFVRKDILHEHKDGEYLLEKGKLFSEREIRRLKKRVH